MDYQKIFIENWGIKLVSLGMSVSLWFYVTSKGKTEMTLTVPLEIRNVPQNMAVVSDVAKDVEVRVQGQERVLRDITSGKKVFGVLDLSFAKPGENIVPISPDDIKRPFGVAVIRTNPYELQVSLEPLVRKAFRLKPVLNGRPASGFRIEDVSVRPARITVEGPQGVMRSMISIHTMPIDVEGARQDFTIVPRIDYSGRPVKILEGDITVRISIEKERR